MVCSARTAILVLLQWRTVLGEHVWLVVDRATTRNSPGLTVVVVPATKEASNPLMQEEKIWEVRWDNTYPTTTWDKERERYRMWYGSSLSCDRYVLVCVYVCVLDWD